MTGPELREAIRARIRKYARAMSDTGGEPPDMLLDDLVTMADVHREIGIEDHIAAQIADDVRAGKVAHADPPPTVPKTTAARRRTPKGTS